MNTSPRRFGRSAAILLTISSTGVLSPTCLSSSYSCLMRIQSGSRFCVSLLRFSTGMTRSARRLVSNALKEASRACWGRWSAANGRILRGTPETRCVDADSRYRIYSSSSCFQRLEETLRMRVLRMCRARAQALARQASKELTRQSSHNLQIGHFSDDSTISQGTVRALGKQHVYMCTWAATNNSTRPECRCSPGTLIDAGKGYADAALL